MKYLLNKVTAFNLEAILKKHKDNPELLAAHLKVAESEGHITKSLADSLLTMAKKSTGTVTQTKTKTEVVDSNLEPYEKKESWFDKWMDRSEERNRNKLAERQLVQQKISESSRSDLEFFIRDTWYTIRSSSIFVKAPTITGIVLWVVLNFFPRGEGAGTASENVNSKETQGVTMYPQMTLKDDLPAVKKQAPVQENPPVKKSAPKISTARAENPNKRLAESYQDDLKRFGFTDGDSIEVVKPKVKEEVPEEKPIKRVRRPRTDYQDNTGEALERVR